MTKYLTIITTVLVLTQVIRLTQNHISLKGMQETHISNKKLMEEWNKVITKLNDLLDKQQ